MKASKSKAPQGRGTEKGSGELERLERILEMMDRHEVAELEWEKSGERLSLRTKSAFSGSGAVQAQHYSNGTGAMASHGEPALRQAPPAAQVPAVAPASAAPAAAPTAKPPEQATNQKQVLSPFVGTFYRSASPTTDPYVRDGQAVKRGDVLCIIEAMKLMNEIEAEFPGKVLSCLVENGQPVEFGEPLFMLEI